MASVVGAITYLETGTLLGLALSLAALPALYGIVRTVFRKISASESKKLQHVVNELARLTQGSGD
jgi:hypothetical protein